MSKPSIKPRIAHLVNLLHGGWVCFSEKKTRSSRVRVTDARDLTPEQAVRKVLQKVYSVHDSQTFIEHLARLVGMKAYLADGKVCMRRSKK